MNIPARQPSQRALVGYVGIALATVAWAASSTGASATGAAPAAAARADGAVASGIVIARKACDLLTRPDAEAAVGQPLPKRDANITLGTCQYTADDFSAGATLAVGSWKSAKNEATSGEHQPQPMSGIGDDALYFAGSKKGGSPLYVRKGDEGFMLLLTGPNIDRIASADALVIEKVLALKIVAKF